MKRMSLSVRYSVLVPCVVALAFTCSVTAQLRLDAMRQRSFDEELLYLPNEKLLNHFTAGMSSVVADVLWLKCIQYTATHFRGDYKFTWLDHMCRTITRLDPYFIDVYRYGGMFLASLKADDDAGLDLLKRGAIANPDSWVIPYEMALIYLVNRRDQPETPERAAHYLKMAVATQKAPASVLTFAANLQAKHDLSEMEREMWQELARSSTDSFMRELARRKLHELDIRKNAAQLNQAAQRYREMAGRPPERIADLIRAHLITGLSADPLGGEYFIDAEGTVQNTILLDEGVARRLNRIRGAIDAFRNQEGRWPESLAELVERGLLGSVPRHPYAGRSWTYDPATGSVE